MNFGEPITGKQLLEMDIPDETSEQAYRRGYRDGVIYAIEHLRWYTFLEKFIESFWTWACHGELFSWWRRSDDSPDELECPPEHGFDASKLCNRDYPEYRYFEDADGYAITWCPVCRKFHYHSADPPGHRVSHCGRAPFVNTGYKIKPYTKKDLRKILSCCKYMLDKK